MSNYSKTTDFEAKDSLPTGDSGKIIRGAEFETEFDAISTAIATKADTAGPTFTGTLTFETISDGTIGVTAFVDEDNMASNSATLVPTQQSVKAYVDSQVTAQDLDFQADSGGALSIDLDSEALTLTGGTGIDTSGALNEVTFAIDSTVATLTGTQTLTNKTLTAPTISGNLTTDGNIDGRDVATDGAKLDGIEAGATADQTAAEIRTLVDSATDSNVFTDADHTKLDGIEASATADQTDAEIRAAVEAATDSNVFTDADHTKLDGIEASADVTDTANVTAAGALMDSEVTNLAQVKAFDSADYATAAQGSTADSALQNVVEDTTPQLGGDLASNGNDILFADSDKAIFGAGSDLQIYHDGSHSYVSDQGTGNMLVLADNFEVNNSANNENKIVATTNGAVTLYYDNAAKIATTSTGIDVTGTVTADGLTVEKDNEAVATFYRPNSSEAAAFNVNFDFNTANGTQETFAQIRADNDGNANASQDGALSIRTANSGSLLTRFKADENGDISFYEDTGTTAKLFWDASAESLGIGTSSPSYTLDVRNSADAVVQARTTTNASGNDAYFRASLAGANAGDAFVQFDIDSVGGYALGIDNSDSDKFKLTYGGPATPSSGTTLMTVDSSGNVGIGTSSPTNSLEIQNSTVGTGNGSNNTLALRYNSTTLYGQHYMDANGIYHILADNSGSAGGNMQLDADTTIRLATGSTPTERMRIDSSGRVGIGTSSPVSFGTNNLGLTVNGSAGSHIAWQNNGTNVAFAYNVGNNFLIGSEQAGSSTIFTSAGTQRMRIDSSGNLLVGGSSAYAQGATTIASGGVLYVSRSGGGPATFRRNSSDGTIITLEKDGSAVGSIFNSGTTMGVGSLDTGVLLANNIDAILPWNASTNAERDGAIDLGRSSGRFKDLHLSGTPYIGGTSAGQSVIQMLANPTNGANTIHFGDSASGSDTYAGYINYAHDSNSMQFATNQLERMRLDGSGNLLVGTTGTIDSGTSFKSGTPLGVYRTTGTAAGGIISWWSDNGSTQSLKGYTRADGGIANYSANDVNLSDERVKTNIAPLGSMWDKFKALEIVTFKYKDQTHDNDNIGVIAQQVESVAPEFVDNEGFGETPEGEEPLKAIFTADLYHATIRALQEAMNRIETLEAEVTALKGD